MRTIVLFVMAAASYAIGSRTVPLAVVLCVVPFNLVMQYLHARRGRAHRLLTVDHVLAASMTVLDSRVFVASVVCVIVCMLNATIARSSRESQRAGLVAALLFFVGAVVHHDLSVAWFSVPAVVSGLSLTRFLSSIQASAANTATRLTDLLNGIDATILEVDLDSGRLLYSNRTGGKRGAVPKTLDEILALAHHDDRERVAAVLDQAARDGRQHSCDFRVVGKTGDVRFFEQRVSVSQRGSSRRLRSVLIDVSDRRRVEDLMTYRATHDALTDLPNRVLLNETLQSICTSTTPGIEHAVLMLDLDDFKDINDGFGHEEGDRLLVQIASRIEAAIAESPCDNALVSRLGGDEFAIVLHDCDEQQAGAISALIHQKVREPFVTKRLSIRPDVSIGITQYPRDATTPTELLSFADIAMYRAKRSGTGSAFYNNDFDQTPAVRMQLVAELRDALVDGQIEPWFQPLVDSRSGAIVGCEALARWRHPRRGILTPDEFLPLIAGSSVMGELARVIVSSAVRNIRGWLDQGVAVPVSINLTGNDVADPTLVSFVANTLGEHRVDPSLLTIELTESELLVHTDETIAGLLALQRLGVGTAVDDFGTGASSLVWLRDLPVNRLKIDRSFVEHVCGDERSRAIVRATIDMAKELGLETVGEGVENNDTATALTNLGCSQLQGYFFSRPVSAAIMEVQLRTGLHPAVAQT